MCHIYWGNALIIETRNDDGVHAEEKAIHKLLYYLKRKRLDIKRHFRVKATLIVFRINPETGKIRKSDPCFHCCQRINKYYHLFDKIFWSEEDYNYFTCRPILKSSHITRGNRRKNENIY